MKIEAAFPLDDICSQMRCFNFFLVRDDIHRKYFTQNNCNVQDLFNY